MDSNTWAGMNIKADDSCPIATRDISVNLRNRQKAIDSAGYGPLNPKKPNKQFWDAKAERWDVTTGDAKSQTCGNCAAFIKTPRLLECIDKGLGNESGNSAWDVIDAGDLGYCEAFDFKCAASRTCDAWIVGGPITEEKENNMEEKSLDQMFDELLEIEEKMMPIVPVLPTPNSSGSGMSGNTQRRRGMPPRVRSGWGTMDRPGRNRYKANDEDMQEDEMYYDDEYMDDEYMDDDENKRIGGSPDTIEARNNRALRNTGDYFGGRARPMGSPDTVEARGRNRVRQIGAAFIGAAGPRIPGPIGDNRNRPRPVRGPGRPAPRPTPRPAPNPPIQRNTPRPKPRDWGSDNPAQQISGGIPIKSAWDHEVYEDYGFESKKLPMPGGSGPRPRANTRSADASVGAMNASQARGLRAAGQYFSGQSGSRTSADAMEGRGRARIRQFGANAIGAAGASSSSPVGEPDRRNKITAKPKPSGPNRMARNAWSGSPGGSAPRPRPASLPSLGNLGRQQDKPIQSLAGFSGKAYDEGYEESYDDSDYKGGVGYSSTRRNSFRYGPWKPVGNPGAGVMGRQAIENISDAMPYRRGKASNEEMYWDDEDEIAIEPGAESKAGPLTPQQAAGLRAAGQHFSGQSGSRTSADGMEARGRVRRSQFFETVGREAPKRPRPLSGPAKPAAPKRPSGVGGSADSMERQIRNRPRPSAPLSSASGNRSRNTWSGSPGGNAPRPRPAVQPPARRQSNSLMGSLGGNYDSNQTGPKLFGRRLW